MSGKPPLVCFVIVSYNNESIIERCIKSVASQSYSRFKIVVVDDCSTDSTRRRISQRYPSVIVVKKPKQTGPAISRNIGISKAKGLGAEYVAFLDSDVVLSKDWLQKLVSLMGQDKSIGIAGGKLVYGSDKAIINSAGGGLYKVGIGFDIGSGAPASEHNVKQEVIYSCSAAMLVRLSMLNEIGGFDESFFYGHEDTDLGWRANLSGYRVIYLPSVIASHWVSQTMKGMGERLYFHSVKNRIRMMLKNYEWHNALLFILINMAVTLASIILKKGHRLVRFKGMFWNLSHLKSGLDERRKVQRLRRKPDRDLFRLFSKLKPGSF